MVCSSIVFTSVFTCMDNASVIGTVSHGICYVCTIYGVKIMPRLYF